MDLNIGPSRTWPQTGGNGPRKASPRPMGSFPPSPSIASDLEKSKNPQQNPFRRWPRRLSSHRTAAAMTAEDRPSAKVFPAKSSFPPQSCDRAALTPESRFWRSFKSEEIGGLVSSVTAIDFSPAPPHDLALSASASVALYDGRSLTHPPRAAIASFPDVAYSPSFRSDGRLLAAGCHSGLVQVFDPRTRTALRQLRFHARPARVARFPRLDKLHLFSAADDALLLYWDVASAATPSAPPLLSVRAHKDYIRAGSPSPASPSVFATGSYDHTVALWDVRDNATAGTSPSPILRLKHERPVECVVFLPSGGLLASAGGNSVKIWDIISGGKLLYTMESHNKTVTSLCLAKIPGPTDQQRLLSVSLDGYMKVLDYSAFKITHSMRFPAPLLSIAYSPSCSARVIGTSNGILYVGRRKESKQIGDDKVGSLGEEITARKRILRPSYYRYFHRGQTEKPSEGDTVINKPKKVKLAEHDKLLRKFRHKEALVSALNTDNPQSIVAVMEELVARRKLIRCLSNLDHDELGLLLGFLHKYTTMPRYASFLIGLAHRVLQLRAKDIRESPELLKRVMNLRRQLLEEIRLQTSLQEIQGIVSPLLRIAGR